MSNEKKSVTLPGVRVSATFAKDVEEAVEKLESQGFNPSALRRQLWRSLIDIVSRGEQPAIPIRIFTREEVIRLNGGDM